MQVFNILLMKEIKRIVGINLLVLLGYSLLIRFLFWGNSVSIAMALSIFIFIHFFVTILNGFNYRGEDGNKTSNAYFLSSGVVLLVGISSCFVNAAF